MKKLLIFIALFFISISSHAATVDLEAYIKTSGTQLPNTTDQTFNGVEICSNGNNNENDYPGCDMDHDTGFNNNDNGDPNDDIYTGDMIVRTNDSFTLELTVNANSGDVPNFTITSDLDASGHAGLYWKALPGVCLDGSEITDEGRSLKCIRDDLASGSAEVLDFEVGVYGDAANGKDLDTFTFTVTDDNTGDSATTNTDTILADDDRLKITASPRWNVDLDWRYTVNDYNNSGTMGYLIYYPFTLEVDRVDGTDPSASTLNGTVPEGYLGSENLGTDFDLLINAQIDSTSTQNNSALVQCLGEDTYYENAPIPYYLDTSPNRSVATLPGVSTIGCTQSGTTVAIDYNHIDASLHHIPIYDRAERSLPGYRKYAAVGELQIFVPYDDITGGGQEMTDDDGDTYYEVNITVSLTDFDPDSVSGVSNFNSESESLLDNSIMRILRYYPDGKAGGTFSKTFRSRNGNIIQGSSYSNDGLGDVVAGGEFTTYIYMNNTGTRDYNDTRICDVIDVDTFRITKFTQDYPGYGGTDTPVHLVSGSNTLDYADVNISYGVGYEASSWPPPLDQNNSAAVLAECKDTTNTVWYDDFDAAEAAGPVTKVMVTTRNLEKGKALGYYIHHNATARKVDGSLNDNGAMLANYTAVYEDVLYARDSDHWIPSEKILDPNNNGCDIPNNWNDHTADRACMTLAETTIHVDLNTTSAEYEDSVRVTLDPTFTTDAGEDFDDNVTILSVLTKGLSYVPGSSTYAEPVIGDCNDIPASGLHDDCVATPEDYQVLMWNMGERTTNVLIEDINYTIKVDARAEEGANNKVHAIIEAPLDRSGIGYENKVLTVDVPKKLYITKRVTTPFRDVDQTPIEFVSDLKNALDDPINDIEIIDILPFNDDGVDGVDFTSSGTTTNHLRQPATNYHGTLTFEAAEGLNTCNTSIEWYFSDTDPREIDLSPKDSSNDVGGSTNWCAGDENGPDATCGFDNSAVTAVRLKYSGALDSGELCSMKLQLKPEDNALGDIYTNSSGGAAGDVSLPVMSKDVSAVVPTTLIGDYVWLDANQNGIQDAGETGVSGITVKLLDADNGDAELNSTITDSSGYYKFGGLVPGNYKVQVDLSGTIYTLTEMKQGDDDTLDSDINASDNNKSPLKALASNEGYYDLDIGLVANIAISGTVYDDGNGDDTVNGDAIASPDGTPLYVTLVNDAGDVVASKAVAADGTYGFDQNDGLAPDRNYTIVLSDTNGSDSAALPTDWVNDGEHIGTTAGTDGLTDGVISVALAQTDIGEINFAINKKPTADNSDNGTKQNPGGTTQTALSELQGDDNETPDDLNFSITSLPDNATLYCNGTEITESDLNQTCAADKLSVDPEDGDQNVSFTFVTIDPAEAVSDPATVKIAFTGIILSGNVFDDGDGDDAVNGTGISAPDTTQLYATLLKGTDVVASQAIASDGTYSFTGADGVNADTDYTVVLSTTLNDAASDLPATWNNTGEAINSATGAKDSSADGSIAVRTGTVDMTLVDFGINKQPVAEDVNATEQANPGDTTQVQVPDLEVSDLEDGTPTTVTIETLPDEGTLYYNGTPVSAGELFTDFDNSKLTVDPDGGDVMVSFTYTTTDAAGIKSDTATVMMPFTGLSISGHLFDDGDGDSNVNGDAISAPDGTQLYAVLLDSSGTIVTAEAIGTDGSYKFTDNEGVVVDTNYTVIIATGSTATSPSLPETWNFTGEENNNSGTGNDGEINGILTITLAQESIPNNDFGINKQPVAEDVNETEQLNPGGTTDVQAPDLNISDKEDGIPTTITIKTLPDNATLYYNGTAVTINQVISSFDNTQLTVDPEDGDQNVTFDYTTTDAAGIESDTATVIMPFVGLGISGTLYDDGNGNYNGLVDGTPINSADDTPLYVSLIDTDNKVIVSKPLASDGTYLFRGSEGVTAHTSYTVLLSTVAGIPGSDAPTPTLPTDWNNTGENINSLGTGDDGNPDGLLSVVLDDESVSQADFGINRKPVAEDRTDPARSNPAGDIQYPVPMLPISDVEDGTPSTITIQTLPDARDGILYYDGTPVTAGEIITDYDPDKLTVDPVEGNPTIVFTYTTTDANHIESDVATVTMPFLGEIHIGDRVWMDTNLNGAQDSGEEGVEGINVTLYDSDNNIVKTQTTDNNGHYEFVIMAPGTYRIEFDRDYYYTVECPPCDDDKDSNVHETTNTTPFFDVNWGQTDMTIDAGIRPTAHIGDYFWLDTDGDGIQDPDEEPVAGSRVELLDANMNPVLGPDGEPLVVITDENGHYGFDAPAGELYYVRFTIPQEYLDDGYVFTSHDVSDDDEDSDAATDGIVTLPVVAEEGRNYLTLDAGIACGCSDVDSDSGDALSLFALLLMGTLTLLSGLLLIRRDNA